MRVAHLMRGPWSQGCLNGGMGSLPAHTPCPEDRAVQADMHRLSLNSGPHLSTPSLCSTAPCLPSDWGPAPVNTCLVKHCTLHPL